MKLAIRIIVTRIDNKLRIIVKIVIIVNITITLILATWHGEIYPQEFVGGTLSVRPPWARGYAPKFQTALDGTVAP